MAKKKVAKKKDDPKKEVGEQKDLFELHGPKAKEIIASARRYKNHQAYRVESLAAEVAEKKTLLELLSKANLQPVEGGKIKCVVDGMTITVTPRDELVQVKEAAPVTVKD